MISRLSEQIFVKWLLNGSGVGVRKKFKLLKYEHIVYSFEARNLEIWICNYFREIFKFRDFMNTLQNLFSSYFREKIYINGISRSRASKWYIICSYFKSLNFFGHPLRSHWGVISRKFAQKVAKSKYFLKNKLNRNLQTIIFNMMYNMSMLGHWFSNERWGAEPHFSLIL